jgi:cysteine desulfurase
MTFLYLDNNASTPVDPEVRDSMDKWRGVFGNPHAGHFLGGVARDAIQKARSDVLSVFGLEPAQWKCVFTSGASESNNMVLKGLVFKLIRQDKRRQRPIQLIASKVEHSSVDKCLDYLMDLFGSDRVAVNFLPVDQDGVVDMSKVDEILSKIPFGIDLMTCIHTVAETGAVQPIAQIASILKHICPSALIHCDASQSVGKLSREDLVSMANSVDFITVAGHKFGAPKGIGALLVRESYTDRIDALIHGAGQEFGLRGGTENVTSIVGLGRACEVASMTSPPTPCPADILWEKIFSELSKNEDVKFRRNSTAPTRSPFTLNFSVAGMNGPKMVSDLGNDNVYGVKICFSAGSACHSRGGPSPSKVLDAMGLSEEFSTSGLRLSIGRNTTLAELMQAGSIISEHILKSL